MVAPRLLLLLACAAVLFASAQGQEKPLPEARAIESVSSNYTLPLSTNLLDVPFDVVDRYMSLIPSAKSAFFARKMSAGDILIGFTTVDKNFASTTNFALVSTDISRPSFRTCSPSASSSQAYLACDVAPAAGLLKDATTAEAVQFAASFGAIQPRLNVSCGVLSATSYTYAPATPSSSRLSIVNCLVEMPQTLSHATPPAARSDITATFIVEWAPTAGSIYSSIASTQLVHLSRGSAPFLGGLWKIPAVAAPQSYEISINPEKDMTAANPFIFTSFVFSVKNKITLTITSASKYLFLHAADIRATAASIVVPGPGPTAQLRDIIYAPDLELSVVILSDILQPSAAAPVVLSIDNLGVLNDDMRGFYRSKEDTHNPDSPWIATTQFESTDARRAFFCIDEPSAKARFQISILAPSKLTVLSNMGYLNGQKPEPIGASLLLHKFEPSVVMSSYLVAFVIGNFVAIEKRVTQAKTSHQLQPADVVVRVWGTPLNAAKLQYALDAAAVMIVHFSKVFDFQYPISKCDLIAIPDFSAGAMENWGLITYRETALLIDPETATISNKQRVALVVSHELVHQWFGNLVTAQWWSELWLNEGFATYFEYEGMNGFNPEWKIFKDFNSNDRTGALAYDSSLGSHALSNFQPGPWSPGEIGSMFDSISYDKGGTVLRMANAWLTGAVVNPAPGGAPSRFMDGLRAYLRNKKYGSATYTDMWSSMNAPFDPNFSANMTSWTTSPGYPLVSVSSPANNRIVLSARPYTPALYTSIVQAPVWWIPVTLSVSVEGSPSPITVMKTSFMSNSQLVITLAGKVNWVQVNSDGYGAYRTVYSGDLLTSLLDNALSQQLLSTNDVTSLVDDMNNLMSLNASDSSSAHQSLTSTMRVLHAVVQAIGSYPVAAKVPSTYSRHLLESSNHASGARASGMRLRLSDGNGAEELFQSWRAVLSSLLRIHNRLEGWSLQKRVKSVLLRLSSAISGLVSLNTVKQPHGFQYLASLAFTMAVKFGDQQTITKLTEQFDRYFDPATSRMKPGLDPNLREPVFFAAGTTPQRYPHLVKMLAATTDAAETIRIIRAICEFPTSKENMRTSLEMSLDSFKIRRQDASYALSYVSQNINGGLDTAWQFTADHWSYFMSNALFGSSRIVGIAASYADQDAYNRVKAFFDAHPVDGMQGSYRRVLGRIAENLAWARSADAESATVIPVISKILVLSETVGVDTSLLNAPPPPQRDPPDYKAGSIVFAIFLTGLFVWIIYKTVRQVKMRLQRGNRFTKFDDINEFGFPVRGVNVARDYQGDDAVDTGFVDQTPRSASVANDRL